MPNSMARAIVWANGASSLVTIPQSVQWANGRLVGVIAPAGSPGSPLPTPLRVYYIRITITSGLGVILCQAS